MKSFELGLTPLHLAVKSHNLALVKTLLNNGADPNLGDSEKGLTPLHYAAKLGQVEILKVLLDNPKLSNPLRSDNLGRTVFHHAARFGQNEVLTLLSNHKKTKNGLRIMNRKGRTCLHSAAKADHLGSCKLLLELDESLIDLRDKNRKTPLTLAYHRAKAHMEDAGGSSMKVVDFLNEKRNHRIARLWRNFEKSMNLKHESYDSINYDAFKNIKDLQQSKIPKNLKNYTALWYNAEYFANRSDLVNGMIEPIMNNDGSASLHRVEILYNANGIFCLALIPIDADASDIKIVFSGETDPFKATEYADKVDSYNISIPIITAKLDELTQKFKKPTLTFLGHSIAGLDAQYGVDGLLQAMNADSDSFKNLKKITLATLNSPKVNAAVSKQSCDLVKTLEHRGIPIESYHLNVVGNYTTHFGTSYLFGDHPPNSVHTQSVSIEDRFISEQIREAISTIKHLEKLSKSDKKYQQELQAKKQTAFDVFLKQYHTLGLQSPGKNASSSLTSMALSYVAGLAKNYLLGKDHDTVTAYMSVLKNKEQHENQGVEHQKLIALANECHKIKTEEINASQILKQTATLLKKKRKELQDNIALAHTLKIDFNRNQKLIQEDPFKRSELDLSFEPSNYSSPLEVAKMAYAKYTESDRDSIDKNSRKMRPLIFSAPPENEITFKSLEKEAKEYRKGKDAIEQLYASGEYLFHYLSYKDLKDGMIVPVINDEGALIQYKVTNLIERRGLHAFALAPLKGPSEVKILFRGTADLDSLNRDVDKQGAGYKQMIHKEKTILKRLNDVLAIERKRLSDEKLPDDVKLSIGGHSLGGADAQNFSVLLLKAIAKNNVEGKADVPLDIQNYLAEAIDPSNRNNLSNIRKVRLQTYNAPGISHSMAQQGEQLATFLSNPKNVGLRIEAFFQRVDKDMIQRAGETHLFTKNSYDSVKMHVLKFAGDYGRFLPQRALAHIDFQWKESKRQYLCLDNHKDNRSIISEFDNKLEPNHRFFKWVKDYLQKEYYAKFQPPEKGYRTNNPEFRVQNVPKTKTTAGTHKKASGFSYDFFKNLAHGPTKLVSAPLKIKDYSECSLQTEKTLENKIKEAAEKNDKNSPYYGVKMVKTFEKDRQLVLNVPNASLGENGHDTLKRRYLQESSEVEINLSPNASDAAFFLMIEQSAPFRNPSLEVDRVNNVKTLLKLLEAAKLAGWDLQKDLKLDEQDKKMLQEKSPDYYHRLLHETKTDYQKNIDEDLKHRGGHRPLGSGF